MILITGATGHLGNVLSRRLSDEGEKLRLLLLPGESIAPLNGIKAEVYCGDICDYESVHKAAKGCEAVFHLAGIVSIGGDNHDALRRINVEGAINVAKACRQHGIRMIYTSSVHAFQEPKMGIPISEETEINPGKVPKGYARSKAEAVNAVFKMAREEGLDAVVLFPTGIIGPEDYKPSETGRIIGSVANSLASAMSGKNKRKSLMGFKGEYNFVDVRDVASGLLLAWKKGVSGEGYILGGNKMSIGDIYKLIAKHLGKEVRVMNAPAFLVRMYAGLELFFAIATNRKPKFTPYAVDVLASNCDVDITKAENVLGYKPTAPSVTIGDMTEWFNARMGVKRKRRGLARKRVSAARIF